MKKERAKPIKVPQTQRMTQAEVGILRWAKLYVRACNSVERYQKEGDEHDLLEYVQGLRDRSKENLWKAVERYEEAEWISREREERRIAEQKWFEKLAAHAP